MTLPPALVVLPGPKAALSGAGGAVRLVPAEARERFAVVPRAHIDVGFGAGHLWVGEVYARMVLDAVVERLAPDRAPVPGIWPADRALREGPMERWSDL